jgi:YHS domain-containing protein
MEGLFSLLLFAASFYLMMRLGCGAHMVHGHGGHHGHERGSAGAGATDPVCGMAVAPGTGYTKVHEGRQYPFCSRKCLDKFEANPEQSLTQAGGAR